MSRPIAVNIAGTAVYRRRANVSETPAYHPQPTSNRGQRRSGIRAVMTVCVLAVAVCFSSKFRNGCDASQAAWGSDPPSQRLRQHPKLPPFLDVFLSVRQPNVTTAHAEWVSVGGKRQGVLTRQEGIERLPGLIVIAHDEETNEWFRLTARELAGIGYAVLLVELDVETVRAASSEPPGLPGKIAEERLLADLSAAVRWLRRRQDVFPDRVGALGWSAGGRWALELASATGLQACISCDGPAASDRALLSMLCHTSVMGIWSGATTRNGGFAKRTVFDQALQAAGIEHRFLVFEQAQTGFMNPGDPDRYHHDAAERAWFEMYEFFGKHVEDAPLKDRLASRISPAQQPSQKIATIADLMRVVNTPTGVRGDLARSLREQPKDEAEWSRIRSRSAVIAEVGRILAERSPPRGGRASWRRHLTGYRNAAESIVGAAGCHDYAAAVESLKNLSASCGACHLQHR